MFNHSFQNHALNVYYLQRIVLGIKDAMTNKLKSYHGVYILVEQTNKKHETKRKF